MRSLTSARLRSSALVCTLLAMGVICNAEVEASLEAHQIVAASGDVSIYRVQLDEAQLSTPHRHSGATILVPLQESEIMERVDDTAGPVQWKDRSGITLVSPGTTHSLFNPGGKRLYAIEIELGARKTNLGLTPRFSRQVEQYFSLEDVAIGWHSIAGRSQVTAKAGCEGWAIMLEAGRINLGDVGPAVSKNGADGIAGVQRSAGDIMALENGTSILNASDVPVQVMTVCRLRH